MVVVEAMEGVPASATEKTLPGTIGGSVLATTAPRSPAAIGASSLPAARRRLGGVGPVSGSPAPRATTPEAPHL